MQRTSDALSEDVPKVLQIQRQVSRHSRTSPSQVSVVAAVDANLHTNFPAGEEAKAGVFNVTSYQPPPYHLMLMRSLGQGKLRHSTDAKTGISLQISFSATTHGLVPLSAA